MQAHADPEMDISVVTPNDDGEGVVDGERGQRVGWGGLVFFLCPLLGGLMVFVDNEERDGRRSKTSYRHEHFQPQASPCVCSSPLPARLFTH